MTTTTIQILTVLLCISSTNGRIPPVANLLEENRLLKTQLVEIYESYFAGKKGLILAENLPFTAFPLMTFTIGTPFKGARRKPTGYIINFEQNKNYSKIYDMDKDLYFNPRAKFIIIVPELEENLFKILANSYIINVIVIYQGKKYTYYPYSQENVLNPNTKYEEITWGNLFPNKLPAKWRNTTVAAFWMMKPPYAWCPSCPIKKGMEVEILESFMGLLKFNLEFRQLPYRNWGTDNARNHSFTHGLGALERREADLLMGGFHVVGNDIHKFDVTFSYMEDQLVWIAPMGKTVPTWRRISTFFSFEVWVGLGCSMATTALVWYLVDLVKKRRRNSLIYKMQTVFQLFLVNPMANEPKLWDQRFIFICYMLTVLVFNTAFASKMMFILTGPALIKEIETFDDIIESGLPIGVIPFVHAMFDGASTPFARYFQNNYFYCDNSLVCVNQVSSKQTTITFQYLRVVQLLEGKFWTDFSGEPTIHMVKEKIIDLTIQVFFVKGYPLFPAINKWLIVAKETGLVDFRYNLVRMVYDENAGYHKSKREGFMSKELTFNQLRFLFIMLILGLAGSVGIFILELVFWRIIPKKKQHRV